LRPSWIWRLVLAVAVMTPGRAERGGGGLVGGGALGGAGGVDDLVGQSERLVWLRMLKNSARNCRRVRSVIWVDLSSERSQSA
jgi:hypothetical protein